MERTEAMPAQDQEQVFEYRKQRLTDCLLQKKPIEELVRLAAELFGCPIILTTNYYRVIVQEDLGMPVDDPIWNYAAKTGYCSEDAVASFEHEGITRTVLSNEGAVLLNQGVGEAIPRILQKIQVFGKTGAYIGVFQADRPFEPVDFQTTDLVCQILSLMLEWSGESGQYGMQVQESILSDLLRGELTSATLLGERMRIAQWNPKALFRCVLLIPASTARQIDNSDYLRQSLLRRFRASCVLLVDHGILLLLNYGADRDPEDDETELERIAAHYQLQVLLSSPFPHLIHLRSYYEACLTMSQLPRALRESKRILRFEDVLFPVLGQIFTDRQRRAFTQSQYRILLDHDRENGTEYCKTLRTYVECGCSATKAAQNLYLHRNTMAKRLGRISELCGLSLEDGRALIHFYLSDQLHSTIL